MGRKNKYKQGSDGADKGQGDGPPTQQKVSSAKPPEASTSAAAVAGQQRGPPQGTASEQKQQGSQKQAPQQQQGPQQQHGSQQQQRPQQQKVPQPQEGQQQLQYQQHGHTQQAQQQQSQQQQGIGSPMQQPYQQHGLGVQGGRQAGGPQQQPYQQRGPGGQGGRQAGGPQKQQFEQQQGRGAPIQQQYPQRGHTQQAQQQQSQQQQGRGSPMQQPYQQHGPGAQGGRQAGGPQQQPYQQRGPGGQGGRQEGGPQKQQFEQQQGRGAPIQQQYQQRGHTQQAQQQQLQQQQGRGSPMQQPYQQHGPGAQGGRQAGGPQQQPYQQRGPGPQGGRQPGGPQQRPYQQQGRGSPMQQPYQQSVHGGQGAREAGGRQPSAIVATVLGPCDQGSAVSCTGIKRGTIGRTGQVEANYLKMDLSKMPDVAYQYDVKIDPDRPKKFQRDAFEQFCSEFLPNIYVAFDGSRNCYAVDKLEHLNKCEEVKVMDGNGRSMAFKVTLMETENPVVELASLRSYYNDRIFDKPMRALQCLEVVLSSACHKLSVRAGRSFFKRPDRPYDLTDGYEGWTGLYQAAILGDQPFLNVDISHKSFPKGMSVIEYAENFLFSGRRIDSSTRVDDWQMRGMKSFLKGINVIYRPPECFATAPRNFKVNDISNKPATSHTFKLDDGRETTIANYFESRGYRLRLPQFPCLHVGSTVKAIYVPMELCDIPSGQATNKKDGTRQVTNMIKFAATSTNVRKAKIMELMNHFKHNNFKTIQRFGISIGDNFIVVPTRVLPSPILEYFNQRTSNPFNGSWKMDRCSFHKTMQITNGHKWAILHFRLNFNKIIEFAEAVSKFAKQLNVSLESKPKIIDVSNLDKTFEELKSQKCDLTFVIIPSKGASTLYADIKQKAELRYGLLTQCIKEQTMSSRLVPTLMTNILLKINSKLNGTNHTISPNSSISLKNVMYLGADVTHPSPDQKHIPSVVGVAASHDAHGACYNMQYRLQESAVEKIEDMESIVYEHLKVYAAYQKRYPEHIFYYRDGVSDGQFPIIKNSELRGIERACVRLKIRVKLTCIIVVKRHHTRFFPSGAPSDSNKYNNVEPGTVVDRVIVHPNEMQFFMVSHQSIQGTAKPTRYNVIENQGNLDIDLLQKLTYNLCHMFPRCNRVVSYPAPAYLAHLVAYRGRVYLEGTTRFQDPKSEYKRRLVNANFMQSNPMYFV